MMNNEEIRKLESEILERGYKYVAVDVFTGKWIGGHRWHALNNLKKGNTYWLQRLKKNPNKYKRTPTWRNYEDIEDLVLPETIYCVGRCDGDFVFQRELSAGALALMEGD